MVDPVIDKGPSMGQQIYSQIRDHIPDTIAYVFLALGLLYCFFDPFLAGILVGTILGVYFAQEIIQNSMKFKDFIIENGIFKGFTLLVAVCAFAITAPGICLGLLIGTSVRYGYGIFFKSV